MTIMITATKKKKNEEKKGKKTERGKKGEGRVLYSSSILGIFILSASTTLGHMPKKNEMTMDGKKKWDGCSQRGGAFPARLSEYNEAQQNNAKLRINLYAPWDDSTGRLHVPKGNVGFFSICCLIPFCFNFFFFFFLLPSIIRSYSHTHVVLL